MAAGRKRALPTFNLSFLDIMFCGFGAVVLLVLIVNSQMVHHRKEKGLDLQERLNELEAEVQAGEQLLAELRNSMEQADSAIAAAREQSAVLIKKIRETERKTSTSSGSSLAEKQAIERLESDLKTLEAERKRLLAQKRRNQDSGQKARHFSGEGNRQYLTGLRLGGRRVLILVDASASMLDTTIINIIKRRNLPEKSRLQAPKWQRTVRTVRWLLANLPTDSTVRIAVFNNRTRFLGDSSSKWVPITSRGPVNRMVDQLRNTVPASGTSLSLAFKAASRLSPRPDNILLVTDGLPTLGDEGRGTGKVSSDQRVRLFRQAVSKLPPSVPVNTILLPLEGDPMAAGLYWKLAVSTRGSFLTPSRDWP